MSPTHPVPSGHSWRRWRNTQGVSRRLWGIDARNAFLMIPSKTAAAYPVRWVCFFHRAKSAIDVWWVCELLKGYPGHWCRQCRRRRTKRGGAWRYFCTSFRSCCSKAAFLPRGTSNDVSQNLQDIWCFFFFYQAFPCFVMKIFILQFEVLGKFCYRWLAFWSFTIDSILKLESMGSA